MEVMADWTVQYGKFPVAIQQRLEASYAKQGWAPNFRVADEKGLRAVAPYSAIGVGWLSIIEELNDNLAAIDLDYEIHQIKEKFGTLRFYAQTSFGCGERWDGDLKQHIVYDEQAHARYEQFSALIAEAEKASGTTCEVCGEPGEIRQSRWIKVRCDKHIDI
jgi:hypothetical protein